MTLEAVRIEDWHRWVQEAIPSIINACDTFSAADAVAGDGDLGRNIHAALTTMQQWTLPKDATVAQWISECAAQVAAAAPSSLLTLLSRGLREAAKEAPHTATITVETLRQGSYRALDTILRLSGAIEGDKTVLDALIPAVSALDANGWQSWSDLFQGVAQAARAGANSTVGLPARRGRAGWNPEKARDAIDGGALFMAVALESLAVAVTHAAVQPPLDWGSLVVGNHEPTWHQRAFINLDNAATTPPLRQVADKITAFLPWYSSVHRGTGVKSLLTTALYESARQTVLQFVDADPQYHDVIFVRNTTEAINVLAHLTSQSTSIHVITSEAEHHSNLLPWRQGQSVTIVPISNTGLLDLDALEQALRNTSGSVLVSLSGASNVTGHVLDLPAVSSLVHRYGAELALDAAQLAPHRPIHMATGGNILIDYLAFSGHKLYAPYGTGVLIAPKTRLAQAQPLLVGGGSADLVTPREIFLTAGAARHEAGSPNVLGVVALQAALNTLTTIGWPRIVAHEKHLLKTMINGLHRVAGVEVFGSPEIDRVGVVPFRLAALESDRVAAMLAGDWNIAVRYGCFCAHPLVLRLLAMSDAEAKALALHDSSPHRKALAGLVRASFGVYNTLDDVDQFLHAITAISEGKWTAEEYTPTLDGTVIHRDLLAFVDSIMASLENSGHS